MPIDTLHDDYKAASAMWERCRDACAGQDKIHAGGEKYLDRLDEQTPKQYDAYKRRALYYNAVGRTIDGMSGLIFRKEPKIEVPKSLEFLKVDADTSDTPLTAFAESVVEELLMVGRIGLIADFPVIGRDVTQRGDGVPTQADIKAVGARPFMRAYKAESIVNWEYDRINNRTQLVLVVLQESAVVDRNDRFSPKREMRWRVLHLSQGVYYQEVWRKADRIDGGFELAEGPFIPTLDGVNPMDWIPFWICGPSGISGDVSKSPINDLAHVNLSHYRSTADYEHGLHFAGLPTPIVSGYEFAVGESLALGSTAARGFPDPNAKAYFMEFEGKGLDSLSNRLQEKEAMMAALGARMLANDKRQVEAAETAAIHRSGESSVLASIANAVSELLTKALRACALFAGSNEDISIRLNTDYLPTGMTAQELTALVSSWQSGAISHETLYDNMQRGEIAQSDVSFEDEQERIQSQGPALGAIGADSGDGQ